MGRKSVLSFALQSHENKKTPTSLPHSNGPSSVDTALVPVQSHLLQANISGIFNRSFFVSIRRVFHHSKHYFLPGH